MSEDSIIVLAGNTTTIPLSGAGIYTGTWQNVSRFDHVVINLAGAPVSAHGTLYFEFSPDGTNADVSVPVAVNDLSVVIPLVLVIVLPFFRVRFVNGSTVQTSFRLSSFGMQRGETQITRSLAQVVGNNDPVTATRALIEPSPVGAFGILGADRGVFGGGVTADRIDRVSVKFDAAIANNRVTSTVVGTGSTGQASGQATMSTGAGVTSSARLQSNQSVLYRPGNETYATFSARFTTPTSAASDQRGGLFDDNNGFFVGYAGLTFGFTTRTGGVDTFVALSSFNGDPFNASFLSRFYSGDQLVALDPTKLNVYRIRYGWLGASVATLEVQTPNGLWVVAHRIRFPNTATVPITQTGTLPVRMEVVKSLSDTTNLVVGTCAWAAGSTVSPEGLECYEVLGREEFATAVTAVGLAIPQTVTVRTTNAGRRARLTDLVITISNTVTAGSTLEVRDGSAVGTLIMVVNVPPAPGTATVNIVIDHQFKAPPGFLTSVFLVVPALGATGLVSANVYGYEESV